jgi:DNA repair protein RecN (Recombination protein N)
MLVDALALLLGERATADLVRPGAERAIVEAAFDVSEVAGIPRLAEELGVDLTDGRLVVRREISAAGRSRAWINGSPASVSTLAQLGEVLVDLHGQHQAQSLLRPAVQREILDAFGDAGNEVALVRHAHGAATALAQEEATLLARRDDVRRRADYLRHVAREITGARLHPGEEETLAVEATRLANAEELTRLSGQLVEVLDAGDTGAALHAIGAASRALTALERLDPTTAAWRELLDAAGANLSELVMAVREYASSVEADPDRLAEVERRRDVVYRLTQKYGPTIEDVLKTGETAEKELDLLDTSELDLAALHERRVAADAALREAAARLTAKRRKAAARLARAVDRLLPGLGMPHGRFTVEVETRERSDAHGADDVTFVVQLNPGLDARPLAQVASGGELARLMLALKVVLAAHDAIPTLVFDEVDEGIGGEVAVQIGESLAQVARSRQVLVITHLPQIAARAVHHVSIAKRPRGGIATSDVTVLEGDARVQELARMLGDADEPVAREHARELLKKSAAAARA